MLVLNGGQRELLADKLPDAANLAVAALFFGQFVTGTSFSFPVALTIGGGGIALFASMILFMDYLGRRQQRKARKTV